MRLSGWAAQAEPAGGQRGCGGDLQGVAGQEGQDGQREDRRKRSMSEDGQPECAAGENHQAAEGGAEEGRCEEAARP